MKKIILAAALAVSFAAHAESWVMVQEAENGARLLVDVDKFVANKDTMANGPEIYLAAPFKYFMNGKSTDAVAFVIDRETCKMREGPLVKRTWDGKAWVTVETYWWSSSGTKMYDSAGQALCELYRIRSTPAPTQTPKKSGGFIT